MSVKVLEWPASNFPGDLRCPVTEVAWSSGCWRLRRARNARVRRGTAKVGNIPWGFKPFFPNWVAKGSCLSSGGLEVDPCSLDLAFVFTTFGFNSFYQCQYFCGMTDVVTFRLGTVGVTLADCWRGQHSTSWCWWRGRQKQVPQHVRALESGSAGI